MPRAHSSAVIPAPADAVWNLIRDFNGLTTWFPGVASSEIEAGLASDQVGATRHFYLDDGTEVRETLLDLSDVDRSFCYRIDLAPFPVTDYVARLTCFPVTASNECFITWHTDFECDPSIAAHWVDHFSNGVFAVGLRALQSKFGHAGVSS
ncbi:SRPBCC family protein [Nocardioides sp.]|uniref:SRPBCC family protein n=1 Tax=Nocardioides sp. TaxID=35761 RepID=UPI003784165B